MKNFLYNAIMPLLLVMVFQCFSFSSYAQGGPGCGSLIVTLDDQGSPPPSCCYDIQLDNSAGDCFHQMTVLIDDNATFLGVGAKPGWIATKVGPQELLITHSQGFFPNGVSSPASFCVTGGINPTITFLYNFECGIGEGCFTEIPISGCILSDGIIQGVKYLALGCSTLPYTNQPTIPDWEITLTDANGTVLATTVTDVNGEYAFYDLPPGNYVVKEAVKPGWMAKVPASGQYSVNLSQSETEVQNFGNCPMDCPCDSVQVNLTQLEDGIDTGAYYLSINSMAAFCFSSLDIKVDSGQLVHWTLLLPGWEAVLQGPNLLRLLPPGGILPDGGFIPLTLEVLGAPTHQFTLITNKTGGSTACSLIQVFPFPIIPISKTCCPVGSQPGPQLVVNGNFQGTGGFTSLSPNPGCGCGSNSWCVLSNFTQKCPGWPSRFDCTLQNSSGRFLVIDGHPSNPVNVWNHITPVAVVPGQTYIFSFCVASVYPDAFQLAVQINGTTITGGTITVSQPITAWKRYCIQWTCPAGITTASLSIRQLTGGARRDFGLDDISFRACSAPPCSVTISANPNPFCGTGTLTANASGSGPFAYQWCTGQTSQSINVQGWTCGTVCGVTVTCSDGTTSTASYTLSDNIPPVALCQPGVGVDLGSNCTFAVTPAFVDGGSSDNCQIQSMSVSPNVLGSCSNTIVTLTVTDWCGNTSTCTMGIQTGEGVPPTLVCPASLTANAVPPGCSIVVNGLDPVTLSDNCSTPTLSYAINAGPNISGNAGGTTFNQGSSVVTYTATDQCGNTATCSFTVTVTCQIVECACPAAGSPGPNLVSNGNFEQGNVGFSTDLALGTCSGIGRYNVTPNFNVFCSSWPSRTDHTTGSGKFLNLDGFDSQAGDLWRTQVTLTPNTNYCFSFFWTSVFGLDQSLPLLIEVKNAGGNVVFTTTTNLTTATPLTWLPVSYTFSSLTASGPYTIRIRQTSGAEKRDWGIDDICLRAQPNCLAEFSFQNMGNCGNVQFTNQSTPSTGLNYSWNFADPNSGAGNTSTAQNPTHQFTTCGAYNVTLTISGNGCSSSAMQTVNVADNTLPNAACKPSFTAFLNANCMATITAANIDNGSSDNCPNWSLSVGPSSFTQCGSYPVTLSISDWCGNASNCFSTVIVKETTPPVLSNCPSNIAVVGTLGANGQCTAQVQLPSPPTATDNCDPSVAVSNNAPAIFPSGTTTVVWTATDDCNNTATCSMTVHVGCELCACDGAPQQNLVPNGDFSLGPIGFTSALFGPTTCGAGNYNVLGTFQAFCPSWLNTPAQSPPYMLVIDGADNGNTKTDLWRANVNLVTNTDYCFSFSWISAYTNADNNFQLEAYIPGTPDLIIGTETVVQTSTGSWTKTNFPSFNSGNLSGVQSIRIRQKTGDDHRDFGIDDICLVRNGCVTRPSGMVSWWPMDDAFGDPKAIDLIGPNAATPLPGGFIGSPAPSPVAGRVGGALAFFSPPGTPHLSVPPNSSQDFPAGDFSIDAWVNTNGGTGTQPIVDKLGNSFAGYSFSVQSPNLSNTFYPTLVLGTNTGVEVLQGPPITLNDWNLVSVSVDAQQSLATFCVGDVAQGTFTTLGVPITSAYNATNPGRSLLIGYNQFNPHWGIIIDELEMFNRTVQPAEFQAIFEADTLGKCKPTIDDCACGTVENATLSRTWDWSKPITCNNQNMPVKAPCLKPGQSYVLHADFTCNFPFCADQQINWVLDRPGVLGQVTGLVNSTYPSFDIYLYDTDFPQPGIYQLTVTRMCGLNPCTCTFTFEVLPCDCDCAHLAGQAQQGFTVAGSILNCKRRFKPVANLCATDVVKWYINGPTVGTTTGNAPFLYTFPVSGNYWVCMIVQRIDPITGQFCYYKRCRWVKVQCLGPIGPIGCEQDVIVNGDFVGDPQPGVLGQGGSVDDWTWFPNSGEGAVYVDSSGGACDDGYLVFEGGKDNFGAVYQKVDVAQSNFITLEYFFNNLMGDDLPAGTVLEFRLHADSMPGSDNTVLFTHPVNKDTIERGWQYKFLSKPLGSINPDYKFLIICVRNDDDQTRSFVGLDNLSICTSAGMLTETGEAAPATTMHIFPNPNTGAFTVELPTPAGSGQTFRILDPTGRLVLARPAEAGSARQTLRADELPAGLYFLQVVADGRVLAVEKFVKQ